MGFATASRPWGNGEPVYVAKSEKEKPAGGGGTFSDIANDGLAAPSARFIVLRRCRDRRKKIDAVAPVQD
jgi:hypothetical protein